MTTECAYRIVNTVVIGLLSLHNFLLLYCETPFRDGTACEQVADIHGATSTLYPLYIAQQ